MWQTMLEQLKQDRAENEQAIRQLLAQMAPIQEAIGKLEAEIKRINDLMEWADAHRRDTAEVGGKP